MGSHTPLQDRCGAKRGDGTYCANRYALPPSTPYFVPRCKFHGGFAKLTAASRENDGRPEAKHGMTAAAAKATTRRSPQDKWSLEEYHAELAKLFADPRDKRAMERAPTTTDLSVEIAFWRAKHRQFHRMLEEGQATLCTGRRKVRKADGTEETVEIMADVEDLLARAAQMVERLTKTQNDMHPEQVSGTLSIEISVPTNINQDELDSFPDLEAGGGLDAASPEVQPDSTPIEVDDSPLAGIDP